MDFFDYLPQAKLNAVDKTYPTDATEISALVGMLGQKWDYDNKSALRFSKTSVGTLKWGEYQLVRLDPAMVVAIAGAVRGRPVFWSDESKFYVTCDAAANKKFAGFLLETVTAKGNFTIIQVSGRCGALFAAALTKATPAIMDICTLAISSSLASLDVLADATALTLANSVSIHNIRCQMAVAAPTVAVVNEVYCHTLGIDGPGAQ